VQIGGGGGYFNLGEGEVKYFQGRKNLSFLLFLLSS
jgi:hypothetical protein